MNNLDILNNFIDKLYSNNNNENLVLELDNYINQNKINIYELYNILLEVFIKGINILQISIIYNPQIDVIQYYFNKIKIKINFISCSIQDITNNYNNFYSNRLHRTNTISMNSLILNGTHVYTNNLSDIRTFFSPYSDIHFCVSFSYI